MIKHAYDIELTKAPAKRDASDHAGWCYGYPPGIAPNQWPLDPYSGYPLMHGFTFLLPEDYRCHGPDIVALSFFATAPEHNDGGPLCDEAIEAVLKAGAARPEDEELAAFWGHAQTPHPRMTYMKDILGCAYAVILLTQDEFDGALCPVPDIARHPRLENQKTPTWLQRGQWASEDAQETSKPGLLGRIFSRGKPADAPPLPEMPEVYPFKLRALGGNPHADADFNCGLRLVPRQTDPNAGITPEEFPDEESDYTSRFDPETFEILDWAKGFADNHIGGTMEQIQGVPEGFGPYYIGFEEYFGDYNFGGGNAQLDFKNLKFDWACG